MPRLLPPLSALVPLAVCGWACVADSVDRLPDPTSDSGVSSTVPIGLSSEPGVACQSPGSGGFTRQDGGPDWADIAPGSLSRQTGWGLAVADLSGDGRIDVFVPQNGQDVLLFGQEDGTFTRQLDALPSEEEWGMSVVAFDVEGDGDLDLYVGQVGPNRLLLNDGAGRFTRAPDEGGAAGGNFYTQHVSAGDLDGDGWLDLYVANFIIDDVNLGEPNALYRNRGDGTFEDISWMLTGPALDWPTNAGGFFDADNDGDQDLYVVNDKEALGTHCVLLWNEDGTLRPDDGSAGANLMIDGMGLALADLNDDHLPEMFVTGTMELSLLMSAPDGAWYDAAMAMGVRPEGPRATGWGPEFADLDNDGDLDLLVAFGVAYDLLGHIADEQVVPRDQGYGLWVQLDDGTFLEDTAYWGLESLGSYRGFVLVDLNHDGALDFIDRDTWGTPAIHPGACNDNAWLTLSLRAPAPNTFGVGARIELIAGDRRQERHIYAATTNIAIGGPPEVHFGLGRDERIDALRVHWPDGEVSAIFDVPARQRLIITRDE